MAGQLIFDFDLCRRNCMQLQNIFTTKAARFQQQLHRRNRYRVLVRRVEIKITTADQKVFRVWSLENYETAGFERASGFVEKLHERFKWQVLGEVKSSDRIQTSIRQRSEITERVTLLNVQRQLFALLDQDAIRIDSTRLKALFTQHLEPLAAPTTDVEYAVTDSGLLQHRQVNFHFLFDLFGRAAQDVFEREVK